VAAEALVGLAAASALSAARVVGTDAIKIAARQTGANGIETRGDIKNLFDNSLNIQKFVRLKVQ
jgi:hypothetical protein